MLGWNSSTSFQGVGLMQEPHTGYKRAKSELSWLQVAVQTGGPVVGDKNRVGVIIPGKGHDIPDYE
jgi:hypothetical protein